MFTKGHKISSSKIDEKALARQLRDLKPERQRDLLEAMSRQHGRGAVAKIARKLGYFFQ